MGREIGSGEGGEPGRAVGDVPACRAHRVGTAMKLCRDCGVRPICNKSSRCSPCRRVFDCVGPRFTVEEKTVRTEAMITERFSPAHAEAIRRMAFAPDEMATGDLALAIEVYTEALTP